MKVIATLHDADVCLFVCLFVSSLFIFLVCINSFQICPQLRLGSLPLCDIEGKCLINDSPYFRPWQATTPVVNLG